MNKEDKNFLQILGKLIVKHRLKISKSKEYLANYLSIDIQKLTLIENGEQEISLQTLSKLNKLFTTNLMVDTDKELEELKNKNQKKYASFSVVLGDIICHERKNKKLSQEELAIEIHTTVDYLSKIENGEQEMSLQTLSRLNKLFAINLITATEKKLEKIKIKNQKKYTSFSAVLGSLINSERAKQGLTQDELAKEMRITRVTLSKIENGDTNISALKLALLDTIFGSNLMQETRDKIELLEKNKVEINYSDKENKNNTGKYIAGAAAIAALFALLR
jgi:transcriptional regulator with XRE-family HTH domain